MQSFEQLSERILAHPRFLRLKKQKHHNNDNSVYDHSLAVAQTAYALAVRFRFSEDELRSVVRSALLHDFFEYDWRSDLFRRYLRQFSRAKRLLHMHAFVHGYVAAKHAHHVFVLNPSEWDAVAHHMFPLVSMPHSRIGWVVTLSDKIVATKEVSAGIMSYLSLALRKPV